MTGNADSALARAADAAIVYGPVTEACPLALAPSTSTTVMIALGDALAFVLLEQRQFTADDLRGSTRQGAWAAAWPRWRRACGGDWSYASRPTLTACVRCSRRSGIPGGVPERSCWSMPQGRLTGLFTDSDLARLFESRRDNLLDGPIKAVMTKHPVVVGPEGVSAMRSTS